MAKARRGPALFELLDDDCAQKGGVKVPSWWSRRNRLTNLHADRASRIVAAAPAVVIEEAACPSAGQSDSRRVFEIEGDRIRISLTSVLAAAAVFLGLTTGFAAYGYGTKRGDLVGFRRGFDAGRADVAGAAGDEIQVLRNQPPASHLVGGLIEEAARKSPSSTGAREDRTTPKSAPASADGPAIGWVRNLTYIVAQEFPATSADKARHAREFLAQRGVNTELIPLNKETTLLITAQGYNHKDPAQKRLADQLLEKVRTIGAQYYAAGGGYRLEGYYKTLKQDNW